MDYRAPNIDRTGHEGCSFTDYSGEQSCRAGAAASGPTAAPATMAEAKLPCGCHAAEHWCAAALLFPPRMNFETAVRALSFLVSGDGPALQSTPSLVALQNFNSCDQLCGR